MIEQSLYFDILQVSCNGKSNGFFIILLIVLVDETCCFSSLKMFLPLQSVVRKDRCHITKPTIDWFQHRHSTKKTSPSSLQNESSDDNVLTKGSDASINTIFSSTEKNSSQKDVKLPVVQSSQSGLKHTPLEVKPAQQDIDPSQLPVKPTPAETKPILLEVESSQQELKPIQPIVKPIQPETKPEPELKPTQPEVKPSQPEVKPSQPDTQLPQQPANSSQPSQQSPQPTTKSKSKIKRVSSAMMFASSVRIIEILYDNT